MTLIEALKHCSIENLDTTELLLDIDYDYSDEDKEMYNLLIENLHAFCCDDSCDWEVLNTLEADENLLEAVRDEEDIEKYNLSDSFLNMWLNAAYLTKKGLAYNEIDEDDWQDMYEDIANYEFSLSRLDFKCEYEIDIDLR